MTHSVTNNRCPCLPEPWTGYLSFVCTMLIQPKDTIYLFNLQISETWGRVMRKSPWCLWCHSWIVESKLVAHAPAGQHKLDDQWKHSRVSDAAHYCDSGHRALTRLEEEGRRLLAKTGLQGIRLNSGYKYFFSPSLLLQVNCNWHLSRVCSLGVSYISQLNVFLFQWPGDPL